MSDDSFLPFDLPAICRKKVSANFDGGAISSDGGLLLLREADRRLGLTRMLAFCVQDRRDPSRISHAVEEILLFRMMAIACGHEDADDCDTLRDDPLFKLAAGRLPGSGAPLCSQPTMSRFENMPNRTGAARMTAMMVDLFCKSFAKQPDAITLDIDDTCDPVHGGQQLSLFNAHYDTHCFLPIHIYDVSSGKPVVMFLREGKTPSGKEVALVLKHLVRRIAKHWPTTRITFRGDSHYGRPEAMAWCEANGIEYIFGLAGNSVLHRQVYEAGDALKVLRAEQGADKLRGFTETHYAAASWTTGRRVIARFEATTQGFDVRYIVTTLTGEAQHLYENVYCQRGQAENLIKMHKVQMASHRTSCQSAIANQVRLVLHTGAYWLMLALRNAIPATNELAKAEFDTLRIKLLKIGARIIETASRIRIHLASACPNASLFRLIAGRLAAAGP